RAQVILQVIITHRAQIRHAPACPNKRPRGDGRLLYKVLVRARDADADFNQATDVEKLVVIR
ncbi:hypothetical protein, partial [Rhodocaloribacter sp.]